MFDKDFIEINDETKGVIKFYVHLGQGIKLEIIYPKLICNDAFKRLF